MDTSLRAAALSQGQTTEVMPGYPLNFITSALVTDCLVKQGAVANPPGPMQSKYDDLKGIEIMQTLIADLCVRNPADKDEQISSALATAIHAANAEKDCGVLITRHHYGRFTIALSAKVPYGQTRELDLL